MSETHDVVVIGGGIHGVGVAQAVAAAGHSVLLLEQTALAHGTSSRSSKLVHGGLRYLETGELSLVRESLRERRLLLRLAPDLVRLRPFHIPVYGQNRRPPWMIRIGLGLYALLGGLGEEVRFDTLPRRAWDELDGLSTDGLRAVFRYHDAQTDDAALTAAVMQSALELGAELQLPARFVGAELHRGGCEVRYRVAPPVDQPRVEEPRSDRSGEGSPGPPPAATESGRERTCSARVLVNASGPWANGVLAKIDPAPEPLEIELVQGAHIEVAGQVERGIYYVESPRDGRAVFVMPRGDDRILVGTTEVPFREEDPEGVHALRCEKRYLWRILERHFPRFGRRGSDAIVDAWAGLRVLPAGPGHAFHRSRETILATDRPAGEGPPRVLTIYGGKLTTYRSTAEEVLQQIVPALPGRQPLTDTRQLPLEPPGRELVRITAGSPALLVRGPGAVVR